MSHHSNLFDSAIGSRQRSDSRADLFSFSFGRKSQGKAKSLLRDKTQEKGPILLPLRSSRNSGSNKRKLYEDDSSSDAKSETEAEPFCIPSPSKKIKSKNDGKATSQVSRKPQKATTKNDVEKNSPASKNPQSPKTTPKNDVKVTFPAFRKPRKTASKNDLQVTSPALDSGKPQKTATRNGRERRPITRTRNRTRQIVSSEDEENGSESEVQIMQDFGALPAPASLPKRIRLVQKEKCLAVTVKRLTFDEIAAYANVERKSETNGVKVPVSPSQNQESLHENQAERQGASEQELTSNPSENLEQLDETLPLPYTTINFDRQHLDEDDVASIVDDANSDSSTDVVGDQDGNSLSSGENRPKPTDKQAVEVVATSKESPVIEVETNEDSDSDVEELMQLIISDQPNQYNELRNTDITKNRIGLEKSLTKSHASFVDPRLAKVVEEFPDVKITSADAGDSVRVGYLMLGPKTVRPLDMVTDGRFLYWVIKGRVKVRSCGGYYKKPEEGDKNYLYGRFLTGGACIIVPPYTCYTIENWDNEEALLGYCVIKSTEENNDTDDESRR